MSSTHIQQSAREHPREPSQLRSEFEHQLAKGYCPACGYVEEAEESFFSWFEIESFSATEVKTRLRAAMGMCPRHARRLIDQIGGGHIMTTVLREALAGAQGCLAGTVSPAICPPCEVAATATEGATHVIVSALGDPRLRQIYGEHVGICVPHLVHAARWTEPGNLRLLAEQLHDVLADHDHRASVELLAGRDPDAPRRRRWRDELPARPTTGPIADQVCARLDLEACPACTANGWGDERYLDWYAQRTHAGDPSIDNDPGELCSVHLHDAALADEAAAGHAIQHKRRARRTELRRLLDGLAQSPAPRRGRRARADEIGRPTAQFISEPYCPACHAHVEIERSQLALIEAAVMLAPVRERYKQRHGLCAHHVLQLGAQDSAGLLRTHAQARLALLAWEVDETARKYAWACRHEPRGREQDSWSRALAQLDGRVFEGAPAPCEKEQ